MRVFDFRCHSCDNVYEVFLRSETIPTCPNCGSSDEQEKQLGVGHVYATDDDSPKTQRDLRHYFGNGQYMPGYKRGS